MTPRFLGLELVSLGITLATGVNLFVAVGSLVSSAFEITQCGAGTANCVQTAFDVVMSTWSLAFTVATIKREDGQGTLYTLASNETDHMFEAHIPLEPGQNLKKAAIATGNNGTWHHIATFHHATGGEWLLHYRLAAKEDLGADNDGSYHHLRAHSAAHKPTAMATRSDEDSAGGVVADYLWQDNEMDYWEMFSNVNTDALGNMVSEWMLDNNSEASCAVPSIDGVSGYGSETHYAGADQGVVAYGYNNQPFGFNGRSQGWIDECGVAAGTSAPVVNP